MALMEGKETRVKLGTDTVGKVVSWEVTRNNEVIAADYLGMDFEVGVAGIRGATISMSLLMDTDDTHQTTLLDAARNHTKVTNLRVYEDSTAYIYCDTVTDADAGVFVESFTERGGNRIFLGADLSIKFTGAIGYSS